MGNFSRIGIAFGFGLFMSAPTVADVIIDDHLSYVFSSSLVATGTGFNPAGPVFDVLDLRDEERSDSQTFSLQLDALARTSIQNDAGQDLSATVDTSQSIAVQRNTGEVEFVGSASTSIASVLGDSVYAPASDMLSISELFLNFTLTVPYLIELDLSWLGTPQVNRVDNYQAVYLSNRSGLFVGLGSSPNATSLNDLIPGTYTYNSLLPAGSYQIAYSSGSANQGANSEARIRDISFNTDGGFSARFTQSVPEPAGFALMVLAMGALLRRKIAK